MKTIFKILSILLFVLVSYTMLQAQKVDILDGRGDEESNFFSLIRANHSDSYISFSQGLGNLEPLIFEALVAPYFLLRTSRDSRWGATVSTPILFRMQAEYSFPVRSPGYIPNVTFYHLMDVTSINHLKPCYLYLTLAHHSNGQVDSFYNEDGSINRRSGDFSTNYMEFGVFFNNILVPFDNANDYFRTAIEFHPNIGRSEELEGHYSFVRWHNSFRIFRTPDKGFCEPRVQTKVETTWMFGEINNAHAFSLKERFNFSMNFAIKPQVLKDVSLFVNFYSGKDYYNMFFDRRIWALRFGLQAYSFK
ncbi:MAG: hypothetical protein IH597_09935 [Bacteroidales bacterium]|nr:hypothetical protein [Bacteroidales bacterium]